MEQVTDSPKTMPSSEPREAAPTGSRRPKGWAGHWSAIYNETLRRTFERYPPYPFPIGELIANAPRPFEEALEPAASAAEPTDRSGARLPWRWWRSATYDLFGVTGLVVGILSAAAVAASMLVSALNLPPLLPVPDPPSSRQSNEPSSLPLPDDKAPRTIGPVPPRKAPPPSAR